MLLFFPQPYVGGEGLCFPAFDLPVRKPKPFSIAFRALLAHHAKDQWTFFAQFLFFPHSLYLRPCIYLSCFFLAHTVVDAADHWVTFPQRFVVFIHAFIPL